MSMVWILFFVVSTCCYRSTSGFEISLRDVKRENKATNMVTTSKPQNIIYTPRVGSSKMITNRSSIRVKRQNSGAGKYADASKMPQIKLLRLFLQMFKNAWDAAYVGGSHPFHPNVPKTIVALYKEKVVEFFIPDVGEDPKKQYQ